MTKITVYDPREILLDDDGFLRQSSEWSHLVRDALAAYHGVTEMTESHHNVIFKLRELIASYKKEDLLDEYDRKGFVPVVNQIVALFGSFEVALAIAGSLNPTRIKREREAEEKAQEKARRSAVSNKELEELLGVKFDGDGYFMDFEDWNEELAQLYANTDIQGIKGELTDDHWKVIDFVRDHFGKFGNSPMIRKLCSGTDFSLKYIYELFPLGPVKGVFKIAGLLKPAECHQL